MIELGSKRRLIVLPFPKAPFRFWGVERMPTGAVWIGLGPFLFIRWRRHLL